MNIVTHTPEGIRFQTTIAGPAIRFLAWLIDLFVIICAIVGVSWILSLLLVFDPDIVTGVFTAAAFLVGVGYPIFFEWHWNGQTLGKRILKLQVIDEAAFPLSFSQVLIRNLLRVVDMIPGFYLLGGCVATFSPKGQRLGDIAARTVVARRNQVASIDFTLAQAGRYNSMINHKRASAQLRQRVVPEIAGLALNAMLRRNELDDAARVQIFRQFRTYFEAQSEFPAEATVGITDEHYVRNAVEILFDSSRDKQRTGTATR